VEVACRRRREKGSEQGWKQRGLADLQRVALLPVTLPVQEVSGDLWDGERTKQELVLDSTAATRCQETVSCTRADFKSRTDLVVLRLGNDVEHLVDLGGLELTGTERKLSGGNIKARKKIKRGRHSAAGSCVQRMASRALAVPLVHVDAGLLAREGGEAAAETTDGSQGEGNLDRMRMQRGGGGFG
jgi:hypothetical protein